jgi:hypothetical protein
MFASTNKPYNVSLNIQKHLTSEKHTSTYVHFVLSNLGISAQEAVRQRHAKVKVASNQNFLLHGDEFVAVVGVITDVEKVIENGRTALLHHTHTRTVNINDPISSTTNEQ